MLPLAYLYLYHHDEVTTRNQVHIASLTLNYVSLLLILGIHLIRNVVCVCVSLYISKLPPCQQYM